MNTLKKFDFVATELVSNTTAPTAFPRKGMFVALKIYSITNTGLVCILISASMTILTVLKTVLHQSYFK